MLDCTIGSLPNGTIAVGGGTTQVRVRSDGTNWRTYETPAGGSGGSSDPVSGSWILLESADVTSVSSVDFTEFDDTLYEEYRVAFWGVKGDADEYLTIRTSQDGGATYDSGASDYISTSWFCDPYGFQVQNISSLGITNLTLMESATDKLAYGEFVILSPQTAQYCSIRYELTYHNAETPFQFLSVSGSIMRQANAAVNGLRILLFGGNNITGHFRFMGRFI